MATLSDSRWQNRKEGPNRSKNNGYIVEKVKRPLGSESVNYGDAELLRNISPLQI